MAAAPPGAQVTVVGQVARVELLGGRHPRFVLHVQDDSGTLACTWFHGARYLGKGCSHSDENCLHISYEAGKLEDLTVNGVELVEFGMTVQQALSVGGGLTVRGTVYDPGYWYITTQEAQLGAWVLEKTGMNMHRNIFFGLNNGLPEPLRNPALWMSVGIIFGAIPGLTATLAIALFVPVTFLMSPEHGMIMLGGIYAGGIFGGSISDFLGRKWVIVVSFIICAGSWLLLLVAAGAVIGFAALVRGQAVLLPLVALPFWWRTLAGAYPSLEEAMAAKRGPALAQAVPVRTPYANLVGEFESEPEAAAAAAELARRGVAEGIQALIQELIQEYIVG